MLFATLEDLRRDTPSTIALYKKQQLGFFIVFLVSCTLAFICGADTFDKTSTWFWLIMAVTFLILTLIVSHKYNSIRSEYEDQQTFQKDNELARLKEQVEKLTDTANQYKREAEYHAKQAEDCAKQAERLQAKFNAVSDKNLANYNDLQKMQHVADEFRAERNSMKFETERLNGIIRKLSSEKEQLERELTKLKDKQIAKSRTVTSASPMSVSNTEKLGGISIDTDVDSVMSQLEYEEVTRISPVPQRRTVETDLKLPTRYNLTQEVLDGNYIAFDLETTGLSPSSCEIIELSAVRFRAFHAVKTFSTLIDPKTHIPYEASKVSGITDSDVEGAPVLEEVLDCFKAFIGTDALVGHNIKGFDLKFLHRRGFDVLDPARAYYDTLAISRRLFEKGTVQDNKLPTLLEYFGITRSSEHRGVVDSVSEGTLFAAMISEAYKQEKLDKI